MLPEAVRSGVGKGASTGRVRSEVIFTRKRAADQDEGHS